MGLSRYSCLCFCCALCVLQAGWRAADWGADSIGRLEVPALLKAGGLHHPGPCFGDCCFLVGCLATWTSLPRNLASGLARATTVGCATHRSERSGESVRLRRPVLRAWCLPDALFLSVRLFLYSLVNKCTVIRIPLSVRFLCRNFVTF